MTQILPTTPTQEIEKLCRKVTSNLRNYPASPSSVIWNLFDEVVRLRKKEEARYPTPNTWKFVLQKAAPLPSTPDPLIVQKASGGGARNDLNIVSSIAIQETKAGYQYIVRHGKRVFSLGHDTIFGYDEEWTELPNLPI